MNEEDTFSVLRRRPLSEMFLLIETYAREISFTWTVAERTEFFGAHGWTWEEFRDKTSQKE